MCPVTDVCLGICEGLSRAKSSMRRDGTSARVTHTGQTPRRDLHSGGRKAHAHARTGVSTRRAALSATAEMFISRRKRRGQWTIHKMERSLALKRNEPLTRRTTRMQREPIPSSGESQRETSVYRVTLFL